MPSAAPIALLALLLAAPACSRDGGSGDERGATPAPATGGDLGALTFEATGGTPEARAHFERGVLALHSFWYDEAARSFQAAVDADRSFSMAYWGLAMSQARLLWGDDRPAEARRALNRLPRADLLTPRERAWIDAARALFGTDQVMASRAAFARAMDDLHARFPDDESATFLAAALIATIRPGIPDEPAIRERAGALAAEVFARNPDHPGAAHYLIHAYDTPELAERALPAARAYAKLAPAAFHAQHMPAHIFARLGMWPEALASCQKAWEASLAAAARHDLGPDHHDFHSLTWLVEINFELGRGADAQRWFAIFQDAVRAGLNHQNRLTYVQQATWYLAHTGAWARADELLEPLAARATDDAAAAPGGPTGGDPTESSPSCHAPQGAVGALALLDRRGALAARARAAAEQRDIAGTAARLDEMRAIDTQLRPFLEATQPPQLVAAQDRVNQQTARALTARARGDLRALLAVQEEMAAAGESTAQEGVAGAIIRLESIADVQLALGRAADALATYERVVREHPGRASAMLGAARAAVRARKPDVARGWYQKLAAQWADADPGTPGLDEARAAAAP